MSADLLGLATRSFSLLIWRSGRPDHGYQPTPQHESPAQVGKTKHVPASGNSGDRDSGDAATVGNFLGDLVQPWATNRNAPWVTLVARYSVIIFGALTALEVLRIGHASTRIFEFNVGAFAVALAIAFGVGGIETSRKLWGKYQSPRD